MEKVCKTCEGKGWTKEANEPCEDCEGTGIINDGKPKKPKDHVPGRMAGERVILSKHDHEEISKRIAGLESRLNEAEIRRDNEIGRRQSSENHYKNELEIAKRKATDAETSQKNIHAQMNNMKKDVDNMYILDRKCKDLESELNILKQRNELINEKIRFLMETIMGAEEAYGHIKTVSEFIKAMQETVNKQVILRDEQMERLKEKNE